ncbi:MAG: LysR family transcriptional regulator [Pseudomonadota bacterium]
MEFYQIRYFLAAADQLNFTRAAEICAVSQPALTVAIRKLEEELGGPLFLREHGRVTLTEFGRTMRTYLARIDEMRARAERTAREMLEESGEEINLGIYSTIGPSFVGRGLTAFQASEPGTRLVLYDCWGPRAYDLLLSGAFDAAIVARHAPLPPRIRAQRLYEEPMVLAMATDHPLASRDRITVEDLQGAIYVDRLRCEFRAEIQAMLDRRGIRLEKMIRSEPEDWAQAAVAAGEGVTVVPRDLVWTPGVVTRPIEGVDYSRVIEVTTVDGRAIPAAAQRLVQQLGEMDWAASPFAEAGD